jgi:nitrite reductase (NADH) small subunit/3-phenylpropionate/trans-cinnamate dioxygenase ferredoxin subunit
MSQRIKLCHIDQLPPGRAVEKRIMARRVAVFNDNGSLYGIESDCKHMKASLAVGEVANGIVTCNWHHWKYDLKTGECVGRPGMRLRTYEVEIVDGEVFLVL